MPSSGRRRSGRLAALAGLLTLASALLTLASALLAAAAPAASASAAAGAAHAKKTDGWIQLTHLSPNTPPVDVYLYSFGGQKAVMVLKHVAYGTVSGREACRRRVHRGHARGGCEAGLPAGASHQRSRRPGAANTVAGLGPAKGLRLAVLHDRLTTPKGKSLVRVIQASLRDHQVTVTAGGRCSPSIWPLGT
jgi:hypothetical protein